MGPPCNRREEGETSAGDEEKVMKMIMIVKIMIKRMLCGLVNGHVTGWPTGSSS